MTDVAVWLMRSGSPTTRTEEWISRIGGKLDLEVDVAVVYTMIYITVKDGRGNSQTIIKRTGALSTDFTQFVKIDAMVKSFLDGDLNIDEARKRLKTILKAQTSHPLWVQLVAAAIACGGFEYILLGGLMSAFASMVLGAVVYMIFFHVKKLENRFLQQFVVGLIISVGASLLLPVFRGSSVNEMVSGAIMLFVPGLLISNGFSEIAESSVVSGTAKESEAIALLISLVFGVSIGTVIMGVLKL